MPRKSEKPERPDRHGKLEKQRKLPTHRNLRWKMILDALPTHRLTRYDMTNLGFDVVALYFTLKFAAAAKNELLVAGLWALVLALCLVCFFWASKQ